MSKIDYAQETCFIYKRGDPKITLKDANVRSRLLEADPAQPQSNLNKRVSRFLEAREILGNVFDNLTEKHLQSTLQELELFVNESALYDQLSTVFLVKADVKAYIKQIRTAQPTWHTISIHSKECPNFKSTAKLIVNRFTESNSDLVLDRRLTYDFHVLIDWLQAIKKVPATEKLLVIVEDTGGFDPTILRELIAHMSTYVANRELNLHLILNLAVPLPLIEENLSQDNIIAMRVQVLQGLPSSTDYLKDCERELKESPNLQLLLSPSLLEWVFDYDVPQVSRFLLYAVVAHFAGNPLASVTTVSELVEYSHLVSRLPSLRTKLAENPSFLQMLNKEMPLSDLSMLIPELQVGGKVLETVFNPNYRPLIEQALTDPRIFAETFASANRMSVPSSVLYQLSRESSCYINIYDFYCAFKDMVSPITRSRDQPPTPDDIIPDDISSDWDKQSMAIFLESITSLKMNGILRDCKRKFECVEKVSWKGV